MAFHKIELMNTTNKDIYNKLNALDLLHEIDLIQNELNESRKFAQEVVDNIAGKNTCVNKMDYLHGLRERLHLLICRAESTRLSIREIIIDYIWNR